MSLVVTITYPEIDRCGWFDPVEARRRLIAAQGELVDRLEAALRDATATAT